MGSTPVVLLLPSSSLVVLPSSLLAEVEPSSLLELLLELSVELLPLVELPSSVPDMLVAPLEPTSQPSWPASSPHAARVKARPMAKIFDCACTGAPSW